MPTFTPLLQKSTLLLKSLWLYLSGILSVIVIYYLLIGPTQGIDVVIQSGEYVWPGVFTIAGCVFWAFLLWYSGRTLSYVKQERDRLKYSGSTVAHYYIIPSSMHQVMPRILSYNCFVALQAAIISLPTLLDLGGWGLIGFIMAHNLYFFLLCHSFGDNPKRWATITASLLALGYVAFIIVCITRLNANDFALDPNRHKFRLYIMMMIFFMLQMLAVFLFIRRRKHINEIVGRNANSSRIMLFISFNRKYIAAESGYFKWFNLVSLAALIIYLSAIFFIGIGYFMGALAFCLLALGIIIGVANIITVASIHSRINIFLPIYLLAVIVGQFSDSYEVRTSKTNTPFCYADVRPGTEEYLNRWFRHRDSLIAADTTGKYVKNECFDVYILTANGGASRAGHWTSSALCALQDSSYAKNPNDTFRDHLLCMAGASGGTVGNTAFYSLMKAEREGKIKGGQYTACSNNFFRKDFLTFTLGRLLGPDMLQHIIPAKVMDNRADALERSFSEAPSEPDADPKTDAIIPSFYSRNLSEVFDYSGKLPILMLNTTQVDNSHPGVISSVISDRSRYSKVYKTDVLSLVDEMKAGNETLDLRYSTATILSSRFPYVSPAGKVHDRYFVDGGYYDNSGSGSILEFLYQLKDYLTTHPDIASRYTFHLVHLTNSSVVEDPAKRIHPLTNDLAAPLLTSMATADAGTGFGDQILLDYFSRNFNPGQNMKINFSLYNPNLKNEEEFPMSWVISDYHFDRMCKRLDIVYRNNKKMFRFLKEDNQ